MLNDTIYYKITNEKENHHGYQYQDGMNILDKPFELEGSCVPGGLYFATAEYILGFVEYGVYLREVQLYEDSLSVVDPTGDKMRADKIFLGKKYQLADVETIKMLVSKGAGEIERRIALKWAIVNGYYDVAKYLDDQGTSVLGVGKKVFVDTLVNGHYDVLIKLIPDITEDTNLAILYAIYHNKLDSVKYLYEKHIIKGHHNSYYDIYLACLLGHINLLEYLGKEIKTFFDQNHDILHKIASEEKILKANTSSKDSMIDYGQQIAFRAIRKHNIFEAACQNGPDIVKCLLRHGAKITMFGYGTFACAIKCNKLQVIQYLHQNGADITMFDNRILKCALLVYKNLEITEYLLENINHLAISDITKCTIFYHVCMNNWIKLAHNLCDKGYWVEFREGDIQSMKKNGFSAMVQFINNMKIVHARKMFNEFLNDIDFDDFDD